MTIEYSVLEQFKPFLLGYCNCGCGKPLKRLISNGGNVTRFVEKHQGRTKGLDKHSYKNGRSVSGKGYMVINVPGYFSSGKGGRTRENIYNFQEYYKCCMLPWGVVHHKDGNKKNNMTWNLQGMMSKFHTSFHRLGKHEDTSDRKCFECGSTETYIRKPDGNLKNPRPIWKHLPIDKINWYCGKCYMKLRSRQEKNLDVSISSKEIYIA